MPTISHIAGARYLFRKVSVSHAGPIINDLNLDEGWSPESWQPIEYHGAVKLLVCFVRRDDDEPQMVDVRPVLKRLYELHNEAFEASDTDNAQLFQFLIGRKEGFGDAIRLIEEAMGCGI